jgi:hypothetical protein
VALKETFRDARRFGCSRFEVKFRILVLQASVWLIAEAPVCVSAQQTEDAEKNELLRSKPPGIRPSEIAKSVVR